MSQDNKPTIAEIKDEIIQTNFFQELTPECQFEILNSGIIEYIYQHYNNVVKFQ